MIKLNMSNHDSFGQYKFLGLVSRNVHLILTFESVLHEKNSVRRLMTMLKKLMVMMKYICGKFDLISAMIRSTISCIMFENGQINVAHEKINHLSANGTKWSNTLKKFVGNLPIGRLSAFDNFWDRR